MKKNILAFLILLFAGAAVRAQTCLPEGIVFSSAAQVQQFSTDYPGCVQILGNVQIAMDGTDLTGLEAIEAIDGDLMITGNPALTSLQGLNNLATVGGNLTIGGDVLQPNNPLLASLNGLNSLVRVHGNLGIENHPSLLSLHGLEQLQQVGGELLVYYNQRLKNLQPLAQLDSIGGRLAIIENDSLSQLTGLEQLVAIGGNLFITSNPALLDLDVFQQLHYFHGHLTIENNTALKHLHGLQSIGPVIIGLVINGNSAFTDLTGLENITTATGNVSVGGSVSLKSLVGLHHLDSIGGTLGIGSAFRLHDLTGLEGLRVAKNIQVTYADSLVNLAGLSGLQRVSGSLNIAHNQALTSLQGLESLASVYSLNIESNAKLTSLASMTHLKEINILYISDDDQLSALTGLDSLTKLDELLISENFLLKDLNALSHLQEITHDIVITNNSSLSSIAGLQNISSVGSAPSPPGATHEILIIGNSVLSNCSIYPVCYNLLNNPGLLTVEQNAPGCNTLEEIELHCGGKPVVASVLLDTQGNCQGDPDYPVESVLVHLSAGLQQGLRPTQADGRAVFGYLDMGAFRLDLPQYPSVNWQVCQDSLSFLPDTILEDTIRGRFVLHPLNQCPELTVELGLPPFFRGCLATTPLQVTVRNIGTTPAEGARAAVVMPAGLQLVSAVPPPASQSGDTLFFALGNIPIFQSRTVNMVVQTTCQAVQDDQALCVEAFASLTNPCPAPGPPTSEIRLFSECLSDTTVRFTLKNVGNAPTQNAHDYVIIEDEVILMQAPFTLGPLGSLAVDVPASGATYRMEATKYDDGTLTARAVEQCGGFTPGFVTAYWFNEGLHNYDFDCREIHNAYDPNQKTAIPTGVGPAHLLTANKPLQYTIEFQNTGTDTAFRVLVRDVLPPQLDLTSFRPGASTNPYTWQIAGDTLEVLFSPIALPDSNVNEAASHGWFSFDLDQKPDLPDGTVIQNTASIIFDYNPPIVTNTVWHTIGKLTVSVDEPADGASTWQVAGNPARETATFRSVEMIPGLKRFELADALGRVVRTEHFDGQTFEFRRGRLPGGVYYFRIYDARGRATAGKIVLSE